MTKITRLLFPLVLTLLPACAERDSDDLVGTWTITGMTVNLPIVEQWFGFSSSVTEYRSSGHLIKTHLDGEMHIYETGIYDYRLNYLFDAKIYGILPIKYGGEYRDGGTYQKRDDWLILTSTMPDAKPLLPRELRYRMTTSKLKGAGLTFEEHPQSSVRDSWFVRLSLSDDEGM